MLNAHRATRDMSGQSGQPNKELELSITPLGSRVERTRDNNWGHANATSLNPNDITLSELDCAVKKESSMSPAERWQNNGTF